VGWMWARAGTRTRLWAIRVDGSWGGGGSGQLHEGAVGGSDWAQERIAADMDLLFVLNGIAPHFPFGAAMLHRVAF
jgi:hypothetical protein